MSVVLPAHPALLFDLDGTLIDLAPTPEAVVVPPGLLASLAALGVRLAGAVAIVSGRPVAQVTGLLGDVVPTVAGEHGAALRWRPGEAEERPPLPVLPADWPARAEAAVAAWPGALCERKAHGLVLHFRRCPAAGEALRRVAEVLAAEAPGAFVLVSAAMAWELRPRGVDKAGAVARIMARPPFVGRTPVYLGDDVTDEDGRRAARALGGLGLDVARDFGGPAGVRAWLADLARA